DYRGDESLADPAAWPAALRRCAIRDQRLGMTSIGPHRHDLGLTLGGRSLRDLGSTGQQRTAAVALKLCERVTLAAAAGTEPALLLDDVFAELDPDRRSRLAARLAGSGGGAPQTFVTSPDADELPAAFQLEAFSVDQGRVRPRTDRPRRVA
ncbi:MAG TPA: hypothetical protein VI383_10465, partial [Gemmatimonadales bacterium]|nr:hypothetical protein [Gemmatimonadales bacterium]